MPLNRTNSAPPRELAPAGTHHVICIGHFHVGTQHSEKFNKDDDQIILSFALLDERRSDGNHFFVSKGPLTLSFHEKATLTSLIKGWLGKIPGVGEDFDTSSLLYKQCLLTIVHDRTEKGEYANISGVMALPKGMKEIAYDDSVIDYSPIDPSKPIPEGVPEWIAGKIKNSLEWQAVHGAQASSNGNGQQKSAAPAANGPSYAAPPEKPPTTVKPYLMLLGLKWPFWPKELDAALAAAAQNSNNSPEDIAEAEAALRPHEDSTPF